MLDIFLVLTWGYLGGIILVDTIFGIMYIERSLSNT